MTGKLAIKQGFKAGSPRCGRCKFKPGSPGEGEERIERSPWGTAQTLVGSSFVTSGTQPPSA